jgi:hypothetical protein
LPATWVPRAVCKPLQCPRSRSSPAAALSASDPATALVRTRDARPSWRRAGVLRGFDPAAGGLNDETEEGRTAFDPSAPAQFVPACAPSKRGGLDRARNASLRPIRLVSANRARLGEQIFRTRRVGLECAPQLCHVEPEVAVRGLVAEAPTLRSTVDATANRNLFGADCDWLDWVRLTAHPREAISAREAGNT